MQYWLTETQVEELTGKVRPSAQRRALDTLGYTYRLRPDGSFVVPVAQFQTGDARATNGKAFKLDFSGLGNGTKAA